ncbi:DUF805 domain-containing protein [Flagellimonas myxillae]|uniref:DUF805 domain-containing protein n=1 Tax=Flagellimonas myxillae TaxID=2942214 RepID=UPI00201F7907|nr:DUF805 domain-containing protein [Muricauda myxillae]MCL6268085.1 DUF805 domain-containing protein [Muricauda myxillae]
MNWYLKVLKQYADFKGRARRKEFWMFELFHMIFMVIAIFLDVVLGLADTGVGILYPIYLLGTFVPTLAVTVRRLQDIGKIWTWIFIGLVPAIGGIWLLILLAKDSDQGENNYGINPKLAAA